MFSVILLIPFSVCLNKLKKFDNRGGGGGERDFAGYARAKGSSFRGNLNLGTLWADLPAASCVHWDGFLLGRIVIIMMMI